MLKNSEYMVWYQRFVWRQSEPGTVYLFSCTSLVSSETSLLDPCLQESIPFFQHTLRDTKQGYEYKLLR